MFKKYVFSVISKSRRFFNTKYDIQKNSLKVAIIGSGPAGFYCASRLLKLCQGNINISIDMFESLPFPFGLIRFGVAPDHPEVKVIE